MEEKKTKRDRRRERVERELSTDPTAILLRERIAYHRAKIAEERARRERPLWRRLLPG